MSAAYDEKDAAAELARLITASIRGRRWRDMTPLDVAIYLTEHGVTVSSDQDVTA